MVYYGSGTVPSIRDIRIYIISIAKAWGEGWVQARKGHWGKKN